MTPDSSRNRVFAAFFCACLTACGGGSETAETGQLEAAMRSDSGKGLQAAEIRLLGNRADLISDGDALAEIRIPKGLPEPAIRNTLKVAINGTDVTSAFSLRDDGRWLGLLTGLAIGKNIVEVSAAATRTVRLEVTNHSRGGPIFSGSHQVPYFCATVTAQPATATTPATQPSGLSTEAIDAQCNIATEYKYFYRTTTAGCSTANPDPSPPATPNPNACFKAYNPAAAAPTDLATTTNDSGQTVPYIVRVERGTMNRGIYDIAVLVDPTRPAATQHVWNGKVLFRFAGGGGQPKRQQRPASTWVDEDALSRGYIVGVNSLMDASLNNNRIITAETAMMMKEHIVDAYGPILFTTGRGGSGGSIAQYSIASVHPGILDGAIIDQSLLDYDTSHTENWECSQLVELFDSAPWKNAMASGGYTQAQINAKKAAVNGHRNQLACIAWYNSFGQQRFVGTTYVTRTVPTANRNTGVIVNTTLATPTNGCALPIGLVYDPITNPLGLRCGPWDWMASIVGTTDGGGNSTRDNTGIQYGLKALREGVITPEEFVVLNENVGGIARDGLIGPARGVADPMALETVYKVGLITQRHLGTIAIIDQRGWDDDGVHQQWRSFGVRARMDQANGHHNNQVMWRTVNTNAAMAREALTEMDKWLTALKADTSDTPLPQKIVLAKPSTAFDFCYLSTDTAQTTKVTNQATCDADPMLRIAASPRQAAGGPLAENILKCQLKPVAESDYAPAVLSSSQLARLNAAFATGVCDWSKPGVGQTPTGDAPYTFKAGPGGRPLGPAPAPGQ
jgi:hypothetical protein